MTKAIYALLVLLLTVALVASRRPSQSEGAARRLAKSGKKSKGKKGSPIDEKHNGKKGGKKGKKGEYDEHWEEGKKMIVHPFERVSRLYLTNITQFFFHR